MVFDIYHGTCYGIATSHGGLTHTVNNNTGKVTVIVELPLADNQQTHLV